MITHVAYEVAALERASELYLTTRGSFVYEAFLVHARALLEFYWGRGRKDAALAEEFTADRIAWRTGRHQVSETIKRASRHINQQLAHLSWSRASEGFRNLEPDVPTITTDLLGQWERFVSMLGEADRRLFQAALDKRRAEVRRNDTGGT